MENSKCVPMVLLFQSFINGVFTVLTAQYVVLLVSDDVANFRVRGALVLKAGREPSVSLSQNQLSEEDRTKLKVYYDN